MQLYFKNSKGKETFIADLEKFSDMFGVLTEDIYKRNPNYKVPYTRIWASDDHTITIDIGSHSEFYKLKSDNAPRDMNDYMEEYTNEQKRG